MRRRVIKFGVVIDQPDAVLDAAVARSICFGKAGQGIPREEDKSFRARRRIAGRRGPGKVGFRKSPLSMKKNNKINSY